MSDYWVQALVSVGGLALLGQLVGMAIHALTTRARKGKG